MLDVVVHVPIEEPEDRVHVDGARIEPVVEDVLGETEMLGAAEIELKPGAVERRKADQHRRQDRAEINAGDDDQRIDRQIDARGSINLRRARSRARRSFPPRVSRPAACRNSFAEEDHGVLERKDVEKERQNVRRARRDDLRIAADDHRVGVVAGMAPAPDLRLAQDHEAGDLVDRVVHPFGLEGGAVAALVPAAVGRPSRRARHRRERTEPPPSFPRTSSRARPKR